MKSAQKVFMMLQLVVWFFASALVPTIVFGILRYNTARNVFESKVSYTARFNSKDLLEKINLLFTNG